METQTAEGRTTLREIAHSLDCLTEEETATLTGWARATLEAYRKRGKGPSYIRSGKNYLYPRSGIQAFIAENTKERRGCAKGLL